MLQRSAALKAAYEDWLERSGLDLPFRDLPPDQLPDLHASGEFDPKAAQAAIRYLQSNRVYANWPTVGTEPELDYLVRLGTVRLRKGPYLGIGLSGLQGVLDRQARRMAEALPAPLPYEAFAGVVPTGEYNARVQATADGILLLVNSGLMDLLFTVLKCNVATSGDPANPPLLNDWQGSMVLADAFNAYVFGEGSVKARPLPKLDPRREHLLTVLLNLGEAFVLAHEVGHVALGHIEIPPAGGRARVLLTPETELAADAYAVEVVTRMGEGLDGSFIAGGILNTLVVSEAIAAISEAVGLEVSRASTHPAPQLRWERLCKELARRFPGSEPNGRAAVFAGWLLDLHAPVVVQLLRRVEEYVKRPGKWDL